MTGPVREGSPEPLGLTLDGKGANVAVYSAHAAAIELCLFDGHGETEIERLRLPCRTGDVLHGHFEGVRAGQRYALRAYGPYAPAEGHRFNPAKLLADPYARQLDRPFAFAPAMLDYRIEAPRGDFRPCTTDSAPFMPKAIAMAPMAATRAPRAARPWAETVLYELHVRGFTKTHPKVPQAIRGTFAGLAHPAALEHLVRLGVTCIEIMPAAAWIGERHLHAAGLTNYWGYNPVTFIAPDPRLAPGGWAEIAASVAAIKAARIEVILDVVLNHTGEGDELGPTLSLRGLDNASYYRLAPQDLRIPINDTGCGNTLALDRPPVVRLAMDALRTWAELGGIDGFRFDLATTLGRRDDGFDAAAPLLTAIAQDTLLRDLRLIAEPWDMGPGGYRIGEFPPAWGEWNDKFRDTMRKFWRGDPGLLGETATRFTGSSDIFGLRRPPSRSVNFIVAHDGFTLADLVSYEHKHNEANGEANRDGTDANYSWNNGAEGVTADPDILAARRRDQRNLLAVLMLSRGTPMLAMGAESGHTQRGNNNAYAQDNVTAWLGWDSADNTLAAFTARLVALRAAHPALTLDRFLKGEAVDATLIPDAEWRNPDGAPMQPADWPDAQRRTIVAAFYAPAAENRRADRVLVVLHAGHETLDAVLPEARVGYCWRHCLDTAQETGDAGGCLFDGNAVIAIGPRSVAVFEEWPAAASHRAKPHTPQAGAASEHLDRLARAAGIAPEWFDISGERHTVPAATKQALLADMGFAAASNAEVRESLGRLADEQDRRILPATLVAYEHEPLSLRMAAEGGRTPAALIIEREDGTAEPLRLTAGDLESGRAIALDGRSFDTVLATLPPQPAGRHRIFAGGTPEIACNLTVAPRRCFLPEGLVSGPRAFGVAAQLYSLRRPGDQGIGDFTTLGQLAAMAAKAGAATAGLNPLHALFPEDRERVSPYYPSDRRFLDPVYIDAAALKGCRTAAALAERSAQIAALSGQPQVDYASVWELKRAILEASFADFSDLCANSAGAAPVREFEAFLAQGGASLEKFACFEAVSEARQGEAWPRWPAGLAGGDPGALAAFSHGNAKLIRFHAYLQWLADRQFGQAASRGAGSETWLGFYRDLAVGAAPDGAEVWANAGQFLVTASIGAPPDPIAEGGQNWGLRPPNPLAWRASNYRLFNEVLAANMAHAGALRIDHAMGLTRLFVIPGGAGADEGAYLAFPERELIAQLALESARARCLVIGEDLGTVPEHFRATMDAANILSYRVLWFERDANSFNPAASYPAKSVACVTTHDLPTIAGWWQGEDIREKEALGLIPALAADEARKERAAWKRAFLRAIGLDPDIAADASAPLAPSIVAAAHEFILRTSSLLAIAQIDDLAGEVTGVNLPGTDRERPNWRRKLSPAISEFAQSLAALCMR
ncbi:MAG: glycogen debranching protein GlgX [Rhodomicrobium sp.]